MTVMTAWDLFEDLRAAQDEAAGDQGTRLAARPAVHQRRYPRGLGAGGRHLRTQGRLPGGGRASGVKADDLEITFEDGLLTIQGERRFAHDSAEEKMHRTERCYGAFRRSITLPSHVEADKIEASAQDGVLQILVPKAPDVQAKRIRVRAGQGHTALTPGATVKNGS